MSGAQVQRRIPECFESSLRQTGQFELDLPWALSVSHLFRANAVALAAPAVAHPRAEMLNSAPHGRNAQTGLVAPARNGTRGADACPGKLRPNTTLGRRPYVK